MLSPLLVPYAFDECGRRVPAEQLAVLMEDKRATARLQATQSVAVIGRPVRTYRCPACNARVYPHAPRVPEGRYFWAHRPGGSENCPLAGDRPLSPDQINRMIFLGRQEGVAHRDLVTRLVEMARMDPAIDPESIRREEYVPPDPSSDLPHGRFPDVSFIFEGNRVVLEAQLATIALHGINGRRAFYDRNNTTLLWVMPDLDPTLPLRASVRDILADQHGHLFTLPPDRSDAAFLLTLWRYQREGPEDRWNSQTVTLRDAIRVANPFAWSDDFKRRFIAVFRNENLFEVDDHSPYEFTDELVARMGFPDGRLDDKSLAQLVRLLISLEHGDVVGARHPKLISLVNQFSKIDPRLSPLVRAAIEFWQPALLEEESVQAEFSRAGQKRRLEHLAPWSRDSFVGHLREILFPRWRLSPNDAPKS